jgi:hypothetical protein
MSRVSKFLNLTRGTRILLIEATFWLIAAQATLRILPFRSIAPYLGEYMARTPYETGALPEDLIGNISWALATASRHLPWECKCLAQAMAGKAMLTRRGVPSTLYLGLAKDEEGAMHAHAWLRCGDEILTGQYNLAAYKVVASFAEEAE